MRYEDVHPFIQGLLQTLPEPESEWAAADRAKWLQTAANIFDLIYEGDGGLSEQIAPHNIREAAARLRSG